MTAPGARTILGVLTPSSNTRLEPLTSAMVAGLSAVSAHFSRFRVLDVGLAAAHQFDPAGILAAADLLADARADAIVWSGTSGGWRGIPDDRALCAAITERTGVPSTTATLALLEALRRSGARTVGLVTPYPPDMHAAVVATLAGEGVEVISSSAVGTTGSNWELSLIEPDTIATAVFEVADARPDAITVFCTNLAGADRVEEWERRLGLPVLDSVALAVWHGLELAGYAGDAPRGWGSLFALARARTA
ncbi:MAG: Asp/Glu/hydantoin racemase [Marmoricola sp.]|nr:Asp/Glu/hydantoin racemase [Marmoricola sp.]